MIWVLTLLSITILVQSALSKVCEKDVCKILAREINSMIDTTVDPCDDMSAFICGNMDKVYSIPQGETQYNSDSQIEINVKNEIRNLLETQPLQNHSLTQTKAALFYRSCLNMNFRNKETRPTILEVLSGFSLTNKYEDNLLNFLQFGLTTRMVSFEVVQDPYNPEFNMLQIGKPSLILSEGTLQSSNDELEREQIVSYTKFMNKVLDILELWQNDRNIISEIVNLNIKLAKGLPSIADQSNPNKYTNKLKISDIQSRCSEISWIDLINGVMRGSGKQMNTDDVINVFSLDYIDVLCGILKEYDNDDSKKKILKMDLEWAVISDLVPLGSEQLIDAYNQFQSEILGVTGKSELWTTCVSVTSNVLSEIVSSIYVKASFDPSQKKDIELMIVNIKKALKSVIEEITWMDSVTKATALIKLEAITNKIGYPDSLLSESYMSNKYRSMKMSEERFLRNYIDYQKFSNNQILNTVGEKIPKDKWDMGSWEVNAYYNPSSNEIVFPAAQLRYPTYAFGLPDSYNYGSIGSIIGHEILHGFDTDGSKYDSKGMLREWWSKSSREEYSNKTQCIINQYGQYKIYNVSLPSIQTVGEDIADNAGTRMAYIAWKSYSNDKDLVLPNLDLTADQLFFLGQAKAWCTIIKQNALLEKMKGDVHTIWKYRINGPQSNMPEFSKVFKCGRGKKMNRHKKCLVW